MGLTNFPHGISSMGVPIIPGLGMFPTQGNVYFVKPYSGSDSNDGGTPSTALKTLSKAHTLATANQNDIVFLMAESNTAASTFDMLTTALTWSKNAVHLIGVNAGNFIGQRSGLRNSTSVVTIEDLFTVSANNCLIANIEVFQGDVTSTATSPRAMVVSGDRNRIVNCQISGMGDTSMDTTGARSLTISGSENIFQHCYIGLDTIIRSTNKIEVGVTGTSGSKATRNALEDCVISTYQSNTDGKLLAVSYVDRFLLLKNVMFYSAQGITSAAVQTGAISTANMNGRVLGLGGGVFGPADLTTADDSTVYWLSHGSGSSAHVDFGVAYTTDVA